MSTAEMGTSEEAEGRGSGRRLGRVQEREGEYLSEGGSWEWVTSEKSVISVPRFQTGGLQAKYYFALLAQKLSQGIPW